MSSTSLTLTSPMARRQASSKSNKFMKYLPFIVLGLLAVLYAMGFAHAAGTLDATASGQALAGAYNKVNDLTGGYGKGLVIAIGFIVTSFAVLAAQATGPVLKFIGTAIFLSMGLTAALTLSGAVI